MYMLPHKVRTEVEKHSIAIVDLKEKKALRLVPSLKLAEQIDLRGAVSPEMFGNPLQQLRSLKSENAESLGEETLDGQQTLVFEISNAKFLDLTGALKLWVNPKTDLPVKIECLVRGGGAITFDEFKWNEAIDEALFDLDVPKGYREGTLPTGIPQETKK